MLDQYDSIVDLMADPVDRELMRIELYYFSLHRALAEACQLSNIGVNVCDDRSWKKIIASYTSVIDQETYEITDIVDGIIPGVLTVKMKEETILEVLQDPKREKEKAMKHPYQAIARYLPKVRMSLKDRLRYVPKIFEVASAVKRYARESSELAQPQLPG